MPEVRIGADPLRCPLCGEPNACVMAEGRPDEPCWCAGESIPRAVLERVPPGARGAACVCRRCAAQAAQPAS